MEEITISTAFEKLLALWRDRCIDYNLFSENDGKTHTCELGVWGWEPGMQDRVVTANRSTPEQAIMAAIQKWENGEAYESKPILPPYDEG